MAEDQKSRSTLSMDPQMMTRQYSYIVVHHESALPEKERENTMDLAQMAL
jgi:hypothetical protein